jgi:hypothetical protein
MVVTGQGLIVGLACLFYGMVAFHPFFLLRKRTRVSEWLGRLSARRLAGRVFVVSEDRIESVSASKSGPVFAVVALRDGHKGVTWVDRIDHGDGTESFVLRRWTVPVARLESLPTAPSVRKSLEAWRRGSPARRPTADETTSTAVA